MTEGQVQEMLLLSPCVVTFLFVGQSTRPARLMDPVEWHLASTPKWPIDMATVCSVGREVFGKQQAAPTGFVVPAVDTSQL